MITDDTIATVQAALRDAGAAAELIKTVIADLQKAKREEKADRARGATKRAKSQFVVLMVSAPERTDQADRTDRLGWVVQMEESAPPQVAYERLVAARNAFNGSKRGRKVPIHTVGAAMENLRGKWLKSGQPGEKFAIKTRTPVLIQAVASNDLPQ